MLKIKLISLLLPIKIASIIFNPHPVRNDRIKNISKHIPKKATIASSSGNKASPGCARSILVQDDVLISEVLFNPRPGGVDFVEIYNNSGHDIDLSELQLANTNTAGKVANIKNISAKKLTMPEGTFWVITSNQKNIRENYDVKFPNQLIQISSMPAYNNDKGTVVLLSHNQVLDRLDYQSKIHHPLIQDEDGISLERVSFKVPANEPGNFTSAAAAAGFATPTYSNSQSSVDGDSEVFLLSKTFSPDGDNFEDVLKLEYHMKQNSSLATVSIYSDKGRLIRKLLNNQTIGTNGFLTWDGLDDHGGMSNIGIYIVLFDVFDLQGYTKRFKLACVLAGKLN
ncbi:lamin tail domain-containing protein [Pedobacter psychrotolerans]|uniref:lamin tail domain-containing protein n=1 Tax=Pedobacter psychrotolerans TaxID=1843235 RepID=UPI003F9AFF55